MRAGLWPLLPAVAGCLGTWDPALKHDAEPGTYAIAFDSDSLDDASLADLVAFPFLMVHVEEEDDGASLHAWLTIAADGAAPGVLGDQDPCEYVNDLGVAVNIGSISEGAEFTFNDTAAPLLFARLTSEANPPVGDEALPLHEALLDLRFDPETNRPFQAIVQGNLDLTPIASSGVCEDGNGLGCITCRDIPANCVFLGMNLAGAFVTYEGTFDKRFEPDACPLP